ncbi:enhancer of polycomb homolog 1-like [Panonychus citri]|uniref:enhancer of polycomb homolog 1-like n=1 Tax=Panonychus citri TaxID=50023 RepID=UPI002306E054|nr:enhancer of polycomb homolog 1-like [Panonychus citri]
MRGRDPCGDIRMSKLSFRARALDSSKMMPVFRSEEIPDLPDFAAINRSVPQMPTGMEKEEECEHHLQRAISAQQAFGHTGELVIPTPEVFKAPDDFYNALYPTDFKLPRQLIHVAPFDFEQEVPGYDLDSEDETWLGQQKDLSDLTPLKFEEMMDKLEKSSGQQVVLIDEAKLLLKERDDLITAVYDYWVDKRLRTQQSLIPLVKTEKRDGTTNNSPYVAFRRRTEKMQTRKNRKNDEVSYEKMLKLRRDISRAVDLLSLVKHREKLKNEHLQLTLDIFKKRYEMGDYSGQVLAEVSALRLIKPSSTYLPFNSFSGMLKQGDKIRSKIDETLQPPRRKREYRRRHKQGAALVQKTKSTESTEFIYTSDDEILNGSQSQPTSDQEDEDPDGPYAFKRQKGCSYHAPLIEQKGNWPWCSSDEGGLGDKRYRFCLTSINIGLNQRCIGFSRRRVGRGGRIIFDRAWTPMDKYWSKLDSNQEDEEEDDELVNVIKKDWIHYRPKTSPQSCINEEVYQEPETIYDEHGNPIPIVNIDLPTYFDENVESFSSTNKPNNETLDIESFNNHQKELFEMQRKQLERLKEKEEIKITNNCDTNLYPCNVSPEHSFSPSIINNNQFSSMISFSSSETISTTQAPIITTTLTSNPKQNIIINNDNTINSITTTPISTSTQLLTTSVTPTPTPTTITTTTTTTTTTESATTPTTNNTNHIQSNDADSISNTDTNTTNSISTIPQPSTLDSASVNFALRAVVDSVF